MYTVVYTPLVLTAMVGEPLYIDLRDANGEVITITATREEVDPDSVFTTDDATIKKVQEKLKERKEDGMGVFKPIPDNPTPDDCGRSEMMKTARARMEELLGAADMKAIAEGFAKMGEGFNVMDYIPWGGNVRGGESYIASTLAASFACVIIEVSSRVNVDFKFSQEIDLDCTEPIERVADVCMSGNATACEIMANLVRDLCQVSDVSQDMYIALDFQAVIDNEINSEIVESLQQEIKNTEQITEDVIGNFVEAMKTLGVTLPGGDVESLKRVAQEATAFFSTEFTVDTVSEIFSNLAAMQTIKVTGTNASIIRQSMFLDIAIDILLRNQIASSMDRDFSQALDRLYEYYIKSFDDYLKAGLAWVFLIIGIVVVIVILAGIGGVAYFIYTKKQKTGKKMASGNAQGSSPSGNPMASGNAQKADRILDQLERMFPAENTTQSL